MQINTEGARALRGCRQFAVPMLITCILPVCLLVLVLVVAFVPAPAQAQDAPALRQRHASLVEQLANNSFKRPLMIESVQNVNDLQGDAYAVIDQPYGAVAPALLRPNPWCELLILHLNVKGCSTSGSASNETLQLVIGRKADQDLEDAYRVDFKFSAAAPSNDYMKVEMTAETGPLSTRNYRLALEAVPLGATRTFVHMSYAYTYGMAARIAMQGYLSTVGRDKVGFSIVGRGSDGKPEYVGGMRGVIERNTMRYYLAIEAYIGSLSAPRDEQVEKRLRDWFAASECYPLQLHELDRSIYLEMKRREVQRQAAQQPEPPRH